MKILRLINGQFPIIVGTDNNPSLHKATSVRNDKIYGRDDWDLWALMKFRTIGDREVPEDLRRLAAIEWRRRYPPSKKIRDLKPWGSEAQVLSGQVINQLCTALVYGEGFEF